MFEPSSLEDALYSNTTDTVISLCGDMVLCSVVFRSEDDKTVILCRDEYILAESLLDANGVPMAESWD